MNTTALTPQALAPATGADPATWLERADGQCHAVTPANATTLRVCLGRIWLTVEGQPQDHVLHAGQAITLPPGRRAVWQAWAAGGARVALQAAAPPGR